MRRVAARNSDRWRIGAATKLRIGVIDFSSTGPGVSVQPSVASRTLELLPHASIRPVREILLRVDLRYSRLTSGERMLCSANPRSCRA